MSQECSSLILDKVDVLGEKIDALFDTILYLQKLLLEDIPLKYKKAFPKIGKSPSFSCGPFENIPPTCELQDIKDPFPVYPIKIPDSDELNSAKERMKNYEMEKDKIEEVYFTLTEIDEKGHVIYESECRTIKEANDFLKGGKPIVSGMDEDNLSLNFYWMHWSRDAKQKTKRVFKQPE